MRKIAMLFAFVATSLLVGCEGSTGPQGPPGPTVDPYIEEYTLSFDKNLTGNLSMHLIENPRGFIDGDLIFVYIADGKLDNGKLIWTPLPKRYFVDVDNVEKELEFSYEYSPYDFQIIAQANTELEYFNKGKDHPGFLKNRVFRVVFIPGSNPVVNRRNTESVNTNKTEGRTVLSYDEVIRKYNLEDVKVVKNY